MGRAYRVERVIAVQRMVAAAATATAATAAAAGAGAAARLLLCLDQQLAHGAHVLHAHREHHLAPLLPLLVQHVRRLHAWVDAAAAGRGMCFRCATFWGAVQGAGRTV